MRWDDSHDVCTSRTQDGKRSAIPQAVLPLWSRDLDPDQKRLHPPGYRAPCRRKLVPSSCWWFTCSWIEILNGFGGSDPIAARNAGTQSWCGPKSQSSLICHILEVRGNLWLTCELEIVVVCNKVYMRLDRFAVVRPHFWLLLTTCSFSSFQLLATSK
jgi:hypothetical protein